MRGDSLHRGSGPRGTGPSAGCTVGLVLLSALLAAPADRAAAGPPPLLPCPLDGNCAALAAEGLSGPTPVGETVQLRIVFQQAGDDEMAGGADEIAAATLTVGIAGLELADCSPSSADQLNPSFLVPSTSAGRYRVIAQNLTCAGRTSCLCPSGTELRDPYVNLLLVGIPGASGVPPLPNGELVRVTLRVTPAAAQRIPLHIYNALDDRSVFPPPPGGALLSIGDVRAADRTVDPRGPTLNVRVTDGELSALGPTPTAGMTTPTPIAAQCAGDCNGSGEVTISELLTGVGIALGSRPLTSCPVFDCAATGRVEISCLVAAVNAALKGCPHR